MLAGRTFVVMSDEPTESAPRPSIFELYPAETQGTLIVRWPGDQRSVPDEFAEAANRLAVTFRGDPVDDLLLHPFLYLYRHAIETAMKELILDVAAYRRLRGDSGPDVEHDAIVERHKRQVRHDLARLLGEVDTHLAAAEVEALPAAARNVVLLLVDADPTGNSFRFPAEYVETNYIDLPRLAAALSEAFLTIRAGSDLVEEHRQAMLEALEAEAGEW